MISISGISYYFGWSSKRLNKLAFNKADCIFLVKSSKKNNFNFNDKPIFELTCELSTSKFRYFAFSALTNNEKFFNH